MLHPSTVARTAAKYVRQQTMSNDGGSTKNDQGEHLHDTCRYPTALQHRVRTTCLCKLPRLGLAHLGCRRRSCHRNVRVFQQLHCSLMGLGTCCQPSQASIGSSPDLRSRPAVRSAPCSIAIFVPHPPTPLPTHPSRPFIPVHTHTHTHTQRQTPSRTHTHRAQGHAATRPQSPTARPHSHGATKPQRHRQSYGHRHRHRHTSWNPCKRNLQIRRGILRRRTPRKVVGELGFTSEIRCLLPGVTAWTG